MLNKLGEGAFGQVFKVKRKIDGQVYAMKKVTIHMILDQVICYETKITIKRLKRSKNLSVLQR